MYGKPTRCMEIPTKPMKRSTNPLNNYKLKKSIHKERAHALDNILQYKYWNACPQKEN